MHSTTSETYPTPPVAIFRGMPVSTVAQAMVEDAVSYHQKQEEAGSEGATAQSQEVMVANNSVINQLCQPKVRLHGIIC